MKDRLARRIRESGGAGGTDSLLPIADHTSSTRHVVLRNPAVGVRSLARQASRLTHKQPRRLDL